MLYTHTKRCRSLYLYTLITLLILGSLCAVTFVIPLRAITVHNENTKEFFLPYLLWKPDYLFLQWIHSLEKVKITEVYRIENTTFSLEKTEIEGHVPEPWIDGDFESFGDVRIAEWQAKRFESLRIRIGTVAEQKMYTKKKDTPLKYWGKPKDLLTVRIMKLLPTLIVLITHRLKFGTN